MKTAYWIWNNPSCDGVDPDWREITGQEFLTLVRSPEAQGRYFVKLDSDHEDDSDGILVMEATECEYRRWRKEKRRKQYLRDTDPGYTVISYSVLENTNDGCPGEDMPDVGTDIEAECLKSLEISLLRKALAQLTEDEYRLIEYLYLSEIKGTERGYSVITGIPKVTVHNRKMAILKKLKFF